MRQWWLWETLPKIFDLKIFDLLKTFNLITEASGPKQFASDDFNANADNNGQKSEKSDKLKGKVFLFLGD